MKKKLSELYVEQYLNLQNNPGKESFELSKNNLYDDFLMDFTTNQDNN